MMPCSRPPMPSFLSTQWRLARELGADRVELYTAPYAVAHARNESAPVLAAGFTLLSHLEAALKGS